MVLVVLVVMLLSGCSIDTVVSDNVVADTRGMPVVKLIVEGPGGDLVPITYSPIKSMVVVLEYSLLWFVAGVAGALVFGGIKGKLWRRR